MTTFEVLGEARSFYESMWPEDEFPVDEAIELLVQWSD